LGSITNFWREAGKTLTTSVSHQRLIIVLGGVVLIPFYGILFAPFYLFMTCIKFFILILLNPKLEEVQLCILEQQLQNTAEPKRSLVTTTHKETLHI
jgi:hypothetical protein